MRVLTELPARLRRITAGSSYRPEIDGLRFWAILPVVLWHGIQRISRAQPDLSEFERSMMLWVPEAHTGVLLFFVISGFIITAQLIKRRESGNAFEIGSYLYRRVTRIEPPYLLLLLATYLVFTLTPYRPENAVAFWRSPESLDQSFLASFAYAHGLIYNQMPRLFPGGWSLEVEVQFYLLVPAVFALLSKARHIRSRLIVGGIVLLATFMIDQVFEQWLGPTGPHRYTLIRYFFYFWLGTLIAEIDHARHWPRLSVVQWDIVSLLSLLIYLGTGIAEHSDWPISQSTVHIVRLCAIFCMFGGALNGQQFRKLCSMPWIALLGGACYSIYLTHVQVLQLSAPFVYSLFTPNSLLSASLLALVIELPLLLAVALAFYAFVERPFMIPHWPGKTVAWVKARANALRQKPEPSL